MSNVLDFDELNKFYDASDEAIELLANKAAKRFMDLKARLGREDELEDYLVYKLVTQLYDDLNEDNRKTFTALAKRCYKDAVPHGRDVPDTKWVEGLLEDPCPVTRYIYENEADRKCDRAIEAVNSAEGRRQKFNELDKAIRYWAAQTGYYCDYITDMATLKAYEDAGLKKVQWITQRDGKVCEECASRDKKVYPVGNVPAKPHVHCRCVITPYLK